MDQVIKSEQAKNLRLRLIHFHSALMFEEDISLKAKQHNSLSTLVLDFLFMTSQHQKFSNSKILEILNRNITNPEFSAHNAKQAFEALEKYATNILCYPWRKEFRVIKMYSGFYKTWLESKLLHADVFIELLGYIRQDRMTFVLKDLPIDSKDNLQKLALDFFIAQVECNILGKIFEKVKKQQISWAEILRVRLNHVGNIDYCVSLIRKAKQAQENLITIENIPEKTLGNNNYPERNLLLNSDQNNHQTIIYGSKCLEKHKSIKSVKTDCKHLLDVDDSLGLEEDDDTSPVCLSPQLSSSPVPNSSPNRINSSITGKISESAASNIPHSRTAYNRLNNDICELNYSCSTAKSQSSGSGQEFSSKSTLQSRQEKEVAAFAASSSSKCLDHKEILNHSPSMNWPRINDKSKNTRGINNSPPFPEGTFDEHLEASLHLLKDKEKLKKEGSKEDWGFVFSTLPCKGYAKDLKDRGDVLDGVRQEPLKCLTQFQKLSGSSHNAPYATCNTGSNQHSLTPGLRSQRSSWIADETARRSFGNVIDASTKDVQFRKGILSESKSKLEYLRAHRYSADSFPINDPDFTKRLSQNFQEASYSSNNTSIKKTQKSGSSFGLNYADISHHPTFSKLQIDHPKSSYSDVLNDYSHTGNDFRDTRHLSWSETSQNAGTFESRDLSRSLLKNSEISCTLNKHSAEPSHYSSYRVNLENVSSSLTPSTEERFHKEHSNQTKDHSQTISRISSGSSSSHWSCRYCTYLNIMDSKECEMCNKNHSIMKSSSGNSYKCSVCTFMNDKSALKCAACSLELKGCTTYI